MSLVITTLNQGRSLTWVPQNLPEWIDELILVDGLSTDRTEVVAFRQCPDVVVVHQVRRGKSAALRARFAAATGDIIAILDADGNTVPREGQRFVDALKDGADLVKNSHVPPMCTIERNGDIVSNVKLAPAELLRDLRRRRAAQTLERLVSSGRLVVGHRTYGDYHVRIYHGDPPDARVEIGKYCSIGEDVIFPPGGASPKMAFNLSLPAAAGRARTDTRSPAHYEPPARGRA